MNKLKLKHQFLDRLVIHEQDTITRTKRGAPLQDRMPLQTVLEDLQQECLDLTASCSALYASFLKMCEVAGLSFYAYADLPTLNSNDGYLVIFDKQFRKRFLTNGTNPFAQDEMNIRRFLPFYWQRKFALQIISDSGKILSLRDANTKEISKFCINAIPYQPLHGLGIAEYNDNIVCDIEKIAHEAEYLRGEPKFNVGQNSHTGSSIQSVLHSHHSTGTIDQFRLYDNSNNIPTKITNFIGIIDVIQVGTKHDAFFIKLTTDHVTRIEYLDFCIGLRLHLERAFGTKIIDFHFHIIPTKDDRFVTIIAPFSKLVKQKNANAKTMFINPETGANNIELRVAEHLHLANASKKWEINFSDQVMVNECINNGHERLMALYDFTAKTGSRTVVQEYLATRI